MVVGEAAGVTGFVASVVSQGASRPLTPAARHSLAAKAARSTS
jgi:hypothetical protein